METNDRTNLTDQTYFRRNEISKIKKYFNSGINQRKSCSKKLSKYIVALDYIEKVLIFLSTSSGGVCIISCVDVNGAPVGIVSVSFTLIFPLTAIMIKNYWV